MWVDLGDGRWTTLPTQALRRQAFLEFVLAIEYRGTPQSLRYMFRLFDVTKRGLLVRADVRFFMRAVLDKHGTSRALCSLFLNPRTLRAQPRGR